MVVGTQGCVAQSVVTHALLCSVQWFSISLVTQTLCDGILIRMRKIGLFFWAVQRRERLEGQGVEPKHGFCLPKSVRW